MLDANQKIQEKHEHPAKCFICTKQTSILMHFQKIQMKTGYIKYNTKNSRIEPSYKK